MHKYFPPLKNTKIPDRNKTSSIGAIFRCELDPKLNQYVKNINRVVAGRVVNAITDGKLIGRVLVGLDSRNDLQGIDVLINYKNAKDIIKKHGTLDEEDLVVTVNKPSYIYLIQGKFGQDVINYIKVSSDGYVIVSATRINGFAVITMFDRTFLVKRANKYLRNIMRTGKLLYSSGGAA